MNTNADKHPPRPLTPLWKLLPIEFVILNLVAAVCAVLAIYAHWAVAVISALIIGAAVIIAGIKFNQKTMFLTGAIAVLLGMFAILGLGESARISGGGIVQGITVSQAPQHHQAVSFHFTDGKVLAKYAALVTVRTSSYGKSETVNHYWAAPVADAGWSQAKPVSVWAVCGAGPCRSEWRWPHRAGVRADEITDGYRRAIAKAEKKYGLVSVARPLLIRWLADPDVEARKYEVAFWVLLVLFNLGWLAAMIWWRRADRDRGARR